MPFALRVESAPVTLAIVAINVLVFVCLAVASGSWTHIPSRVLIPWGGNDGAMTLTGEPWRLMTSVFLHGGLLHVGLNMLALYQAGNLVERMFGPVRFGVVYLASGLLASLVSVWWRQDVVSVGASGAIFGVFGALLAFLVVHRARMPRQAYARLRTMTLSFVGYSLVIGLAIPGIDNAAHVGGLIGGVAVGWILAATDRPAALRLVVVAVVLALSGAAWQLAERPVAVNPVVAHFAAVQPLLAARQRQVVEDLGEGRLSAAEALRIIETELKPNWDALIGSLAAQAARQKGAPDALLAYAQLERAGLDALSLGLKTGHPSWFETAADLRLQANAALHHLPGVDGRDSH
ncbi:MAG: rhomboid family intramembrane serine protease [Rhodocyclaceae bacterium]|nr:rhomboid family intramembrane serine protease [Rhodocyclaceae bacterium]